MTGTIKLDPATTQVDTGGTFNIKVIVNTTAATSGVSATINFNKSVLQVTSITRAAAWASARLFLAADAKAIATANSTGVLKNVAASFFPPTSVAAGTQEFITVGFKAIACGTVNLKVPISGNDATLLDGRAASYGNTIKITTAGATVTVCQGGGASGSPAASASASPGPSDSGGVLPSDSIDPNASPSAPLPSDQSQTGESPAPSGALLAAAASAAPGDAGSGGTTSEQSGWLTFAMAALAIAAAGLATLILVLTVAAITAAVTGAIVVIRVWRRYSDQDAKSTARNQASDAAPAALTATDAATPEGASDGTPAPGGRAKPAEPAGTPPIGDRPKPTTVPQGA